MTAVRGAATAGVVRRFNDRIRSGGRVDELDGLRALAVLPVVAMHFGVSVNGRAGVTVFFAISGFIVTTLLLSERVRTGRIDVLAFYGRRARRLLPAASVVVVATVLVGAVQGRPPITRQALAAMTYWANFERFTARVPYGGSTYAPLEHFWSLAIEEQFYLVLPLLLVVSLRRGRRSTAVVLLLATAVSGYVAFRSADDARMYFHTGARVGELLLGVLCAVTVPRVARWMGAVSLAVLALVLSGVVTLPLISVAALTCVVALAPPRVLAAPVLVTIGVYSYSLYLWHPLAALLSSGLAIRLVLLAGLAAASFHAVEWPVRRTPSPAMARASIAWLGAAALAVSAVVAVRYRVPPATFDERAVGEAVAVRGDGASVGPIVEAVSARPIRFSAVGDSTQMFASAVWKAWADQRDDRFAWVLPPAEVEPWTSGADDWIDTVLPTSGLVAPRRGPQGGLDRLGCPLVYDYRIRPAPGWDFVDPASWRTPFPAESCDWHRWVPEGLAAMRLDVVIATWAATAMLEYRLDDGAVVQIGSPAFDALLEAEMDEFERMAATFGTRVLWVTYDMQHDEPAEEERLTRGEDRYAEIVLARACSFDLRSVVRADPAFAWYQDGYHFTVWGAARAMAEMASSLVDCATIGRTPGHTS